MGAQANQVRPVHWWGSCLWNSRRDRGQEAWSRWVWQATACHRAWDGVGTSSLRTPGQYTLSDPATKLGLSVFTRANDEKQSLWGNWRRSTTVKC